MSCYYCSKVGYYKCTGCHVYCCSNHINHTHTKYRCTFGSCTNEATYNRGSKGYRCGYHADCVRCK